MKTPKIIKYLITATILLPTQAWAQSVMSQIDAAGDNNCWKEGRCEINDFLNILVIAAEFIIKYSGVLALIAFVYGGILFLTSAGSSERVAKGKKIIIGSLLGLAIVFLSYTIVAFIAQSLGVGGSEGNIFNTGWF